MGILEKIAPGYALKRIRIKNALQAEKRKEEFLNYANFGASTTKNAFKGIDDNLYTADEDIGDNKDILMARSRQLYMGNSIGLAAIRKLRTNIVGTGIKFESKINYQKLGLTEEEGIRIEQDIETLWELWANSTECDITRQSNFYQLQSLALITQLVDGECFVALPFLKEGKDLFELKIQFIDSMRCQQPLTTYNTNIKHGVEVNKYGQPIAYWFKNSETDLEIKRFPIFGANGRRNIIALFEKERIGQRRGVPLLAPVIEDLIQITKYTHAELMNAVVSSLFTIFITNERDDDPRNALFQDEQDNDGDYKLGNGSVVLLQPGQKIEQASSNRPNSNFEGFLFAMAKQVGTALEIPVEVLLSSFNASYSASRAALEEVWKTYKLRRSWLIANFCQPIFEEWLDEAVAKGYLILPGYTDNLLNRKYYQGAEWYGEIQSQIDPVKEAKAAEIRITNGISTIAREARALNGSDWRDNLKQRKKETELMEELNDRSE